MDFDQDDNLPEAGPWEEAQQSRPAGPPPPPLAPVAPPAHPEPPRKRTGWKIFWGIILTLSVIANIVLFLMLIGAVAILAVADKQSLHEEVIQDGPRHSKIAIISLEGVIDDENAREVSRQLKQAREDRHVKGIILRVNSPGGTISGSDQIYNEIKNKTELPAVAFMQGVAASGGYYASVACDKIVAEPTVITGSVGVIGGYMVLKELLEDKLGILPVIVKSGEKKDWPSSFRPPTEEEIQYLHDKLITPAYERFVQIVAEGRKASLTLSEIRQLADGSIYGAQEAKDNKLVDAIGYLDDAIDQAKALAGIKEALVMEYRRPFSFADFLGSSSSKMFEIDESTVYELCTPRLLYLWTLQK